MELRAGARQPHGALHGPLRHLDALYENPLPRAAPRHGFGLLHADLHRTAHLPLRRLQGAAARLGRHLALRPLGRNDGAGGEEKAGRGGQQDGRRNGGTDRGRYGGAGGGTGQAAEQDGRSAGRTERVVSAEKGPARKGGTGRPTEWAEERRRRNGQRTVRRDGQKQPGGGSFRFISINRVFYFEKKEQHFDFLPIFVRRNLKIRIGP